MQVKSHVLFSGTCVVAFSMLGIVPLNPATLGIAAIGSMMPDLDHPGSWLGRRLPFISIPISAVFGHRGITHSLIAIIAMSLALSNYFSVNDLMRALIVGYLSHLLGDCFTKKGIPLMWPNKDAWKMPLTFKTGSNHEKVFIMLTTALGIYFAIKDYL